MPANHEDQDRYVAIWSKVVETQMHFNEMSVKSRQLGLTFVAAALGVAIVLLSRGDDFSLLMDFRVFKFELHIAVILLLGAWLALTAVKDLDLNVYHRMLRGAVTFGEDFEENYMKKIFDLEKGMTQSISHFSRYTDAAVTADDNRKYQYGGVAKETAASKIEEFYRKTKIFLLSAAVGVLILTNSGLLEDSPDIPSSQEEVMNHEVRTAPTSSSESVATPDRALRQEGLESQVVGEDDESTE